MYASMTFFDLRYCSIFFYIFYISQAHIFVPYFHITFFHLTYCHYLKKNYVDLIFLESQTDDRRHTSAFPQHEPSV